MSDKGYTKEDWKLFCEKVGKWQEAYISKLNLEYIALLNGPKTPSDKFWELDERLTKDKKKAGVQINLIASEMPFNLTRMIHEGVIDERDLDDFSPLLQAKVKNMLSM